MCLSALATLSPIILATLLSSATSDTSCHSHNAVLDMNDNLLPAYASVDSTECFDDCLANDECYFAYFDNANGLCALKDRKNKNWDMDPAVDAVIMPKNCGEKRKS